MRNTFLLCSVLLVSSCDWREKFSYRVFKLDEAQLLTSIDSIYDLRPQYTCPAKWKIIDSYSIAGDFSSARRFYFSSPNEEMYYVTIFPFERQTKIIISAVHTNTGWHSEKDLPSAEVMRIQKRFDDKIISELESLTNSKSSVED